MLKLFKFNIDYMTKDGYDLYDLYSENEDISSILDLPEKSFFDDFNNSGYFNAVRYNFIYENNPNLIGLMNCSYVVQRLKENVWKKKRKETI